MCITIRESDDGTLYVALSGGPGIPHVDPVAQRIVFDAVDAHNDSLRAGRGPIVSLQPSHDECSGRYSSSFARPRHIPATLPPVVRLPAQRRRSWRLPLVLTAFVLAMCLAVFIVPPIFGNAPGNVSRPVLVDFLPPQLHTPGVER